MNDVPHRPPRRRSPLRAIPLTSSGTGRPRTARSSAFVRCDPTTSKAKSGSSAGLSEQTLYLRLQYSSREVSRADAERLLAVDYHDTMAIGALVEGPQGDEIVGVSRYARIDDSDRAECAIVVTDAWHGRGLGTELMRSLGIAARARGIRRWKAASLGENQRIHAWARRFGFQVRTEPNTGGQVVIKLDLASLPA